MKLSRKALQSDFSPMRKYYKASIEAKNRGISIYHLNIGQPDIETPKEYFKAIRGFNSKTDAYAPSQGSEDLLAAVVKYYKSIGQDITKDNVVITTGGSEALLFAAICTMDYGDEVLIPEPFYPNYATIFNAAGGVIKPIHTLHSEDYFYADPKKIGKLITRKTKALLLSNPNNPTGTAIGDKQMLDMLELCRENDIFLICDEVYREIYFGKEQKSSSALQFRDYDENVVVIDSASKRFSCCGSRIGALISRNNDIIQNSLKFAQARLSVSTINQAGAIALFDGITEKYSKELCEKYKRRIDVAVSELEKIPGVEVSVPAGAFYIMAALPIEDADEFQSWLLSSFDDNKETVMFAPGR
ncbi:MAG TPA: aspartate aminotransferase, partial [Spirochaetaceae bacterium]|nr:aspartate aminotransferase [Spirochaetaceae bacterium]